MGEPDVVHLPAGTDPARRTRGLLAAERAEKLLLYTPGLEGFLEALVRFAVRSLDGPPTLQCGLTVDRADRPVTAASTDESAERLDRMQYRLQQGPCLDGLRSGAVVRSDDLPSDLRWPGYARAAEGHGVRSVLAVPFRLLPGRRAVLNCYARPVSSFDDEFVAVVEPLVQVFSGALELAVEFDQQHRRAEDLDTAMRSRTVIDLAVGIVMGQHRCTQEQALELLLRTSSERSTGLHALAAQVVEHMGVPTCTRADDRPAP